MIPARINAPNTISPITPNSRYTPIPMESSPLLRGVKPVSL
jgi:hypothetical protein